MNLKSGTNILYWRTTGILVGGKMVKPVLLKSIQIEGEQQHICITSAPAQHLELSARHLELSRALPPSRRRLHVRVFLLPPRLVQPGSWLLLLRTLSQQHLLLEGGVLVHALS